MNSPASLHRRNDTDIVTRIVGPFACHCSGCGINPAGAYVTTPLIGLGVIPQSGSPGSSHLLDSILAFDKAEAETANITQTNLVQVSSFNGPNGLLLGYDLLSQPLSPHLLLPSNSCNVLDAAPLFATTRALYGTISAPRFPIAPGQHILCAYKTLCLNGPCRLYGALAVAIPADRTRNADLFLEDHGTLQEASNDTAQERAVLERLVDATQQIGDNLRVEYQTVLVGFRSCIVPSGEVGCVLTAAPYIHLAQRAIPQGKPELLLEMTLPEWEQATSADWLSHQVP